MNRYAESIPVHHDDHHHRALAHQQQADVHRQHADFYHRQAHFHHQNANYHDQQAHYFRQQSMMPGYAILPPYDTHHTASQGYVTPAALAIDGEISPQALASLSQYYQSVGPR
ncbi:hypothetical protein LOK74_07840 [Brevibacillus humidisoli]|uniref:hypothetical protein n=1 Tax=Brevibacillus humidisoli TaxID=2895522 RepID=UPI001E646DA1|nr:hypothetical protein [Brevibacillus humidisoli]UFJ42386.1 hypothetical protein LOK74_07840 [Brevibacillus humidisoli]